MRGRHWGQLSQYRNVSRTRVATLNMGTLTDRSCELVEALERRRVDFCALQETRWSCSKSRDIGRDFKAVLCGSPRTTSGVGIIVSERFRDSIVNVERFDDRLMKIVIALRSDYFTSSLRMLRRLAAPIKRRMSFGTCLMRGQQRCRRKMSS
ncbi:unnamed protein product [Heligmosomoides polygyrus]|uniref:Endo/exonuclease/phosphatase domain-containing protein n=1 Tax=Heligmosomoides polygyrus TaxID=6339 RepID=A0A183GD23_HELPZ|nr:unnamed protein product [Heligmosomoides polygyrus]